VEDMARVLRKDTKVYPTFNGLMSATMQTELGAFVSSVIIDGTGRFADLLTSTSTFVKQENNVYGAALANPKAFVLTNLDPAQRAGILTLGPFLAEHAAPGGSHPVKRGKVVFEQLLCGAIPPPPPVVPPLTAPAANVTTRERFAQHASNPSCAACHGIFDSLGFAFENYDGLGQYRTMDGSKPVDASGTVTLPSGTEVAFKNALDLTRALATSDDARRCMMTQWFRYALDRREDTGDNASFAALLSDFAKSDFNLRELLVSLVQSPLFLYRRPAAGEVL